MTTIVIDKERGVCHDKFRGNCGGGRLRLYERNIRKYKGPLVVNVVYKWCHNHYQLHRLGWRQVRSLKGR